MLKSELIKAHDRKLRVWHFLQEADVQGMTRSELLMTTRYKVEVLDAILEAFATAGDIVARLDDRGKQGRVPMRYWCTKVAPDLTAASNDGTVESATESSPTGDTVSCQQCGRAIPVQGPGRRPTYCSPVCKKMASERSALTAFLARAPSDHARSLAALHFVAMDLIYRGFHVALDFPSTVARLIITDAETAIPLYVYATDERGILPCGRDNHAAFAVVAHDGQITYGGKTPIVTDSPAPPEPPVPVQDIQDF